METATRLFGLPPQAATDPFNTISRLQHKLLSLKHIHGRSKIYPGKSHQIQVKKFRWSVPVPQLLIASHPTPAREGRLTFSLRSNPFQPVSGRTGASPLSIISLGCEKFQNPRSSSIQSFTQHQKLPNEPLVPIPQTVRQPPSCHSCIAHRIRLQWETMLNTTRSIKRNGRD
jgi:hypothetical protein